jgi:hypothetical protein
MFLPLSFCGGIVVACRIFCTSGTETIAPGQSIQPLLIAPPMWEFPPLIGGLHRNIPVVAHVT